MAQPASGEITREELIIQQFAAGFNIRGESEYLKFKKSLESEDNVKILFNFTSEKNDIESLICLQKDQDTAYFLGDPPTPAQVKRKAIVAIKVSREPLTPKTVKRDLVFCEFTRQILEHLYQMFNEVYSPILQNPNNQKSWPDIVSKDLTEKFNNYLAQVFITIGQIHGKTLLPLPPQRLTVSDTPDKDKAHIFESSIILWTRQIKNVLKMEPEQVFRQKEDPDPLVEIQFWKNKAENLNAIHHQLNSERIRKILKFLEQNKSTYHAPFCKLQKEVQVYRNEANDNYKFLRTLEDYFSTMLESNTDFPQLVDLYVPIMHTILLIWQRSKHYNTPPRLVVLIREICNAIITKSKDFVSGQLIIQMLENEAQEAYEKLRVTIDVCTKFKDTYFEYKAKANEKWKLTTNALFVRLDSFLERCHDIQHLCETIVQFNKLDNKEVGGTKGKTLSESIRQIHTEFKAAVEQFSAVKYDIMNIAIKEFDEDFYTFRNKIKELERRLASVITIGFDDADTLTGKFKILESFDVLLQRPIIQDELEKKQIVLIETYKNDLKTVQQIFLEGKVLVDKFDEKAPIYNNLPPIAGALTWARGLLERIKEPMEKLQTLSAAFMEREEYKDVHKLYMSLSKAIKDYEETKRLAWAKEVESSAKDKLNLALLYRDEAGLLKVNFDPSLIRVLREVKYFNLLDVEVPPSAAEIYEKNEMYRTQITALDMITTTYNNIINCLHPVEEPLIRDRIQKMDNTLEPGVKELKWKSPNINQFIDNANAIVGDVNKIVQKMKDEIERIKRCLENFDKPLLERERKHAKAMSPDDFDLTYKAIIGNKHNLIKQEGTQIHKAVREINEAIRVDKKSNVWRNYQDYINDIIIAGVAKIVQTSLLHLGDMLIYNSTKKQEPLFEVRLELGPANIKYEPEIEETEKGNSVHNTILSYVQDFYHVGTLITRLDTGGVGDYLTELKDNFELRDCMSLASGCLEQLETEAIKYREQFKSYSYLWTLDAAQSFEEFLLAEEAKEEAIQAEKEKKEREAGKEKQEKEDRGPEEFDFGRSQDNPLLKGARGRIPGLILFDEKITNLKTIQVEISAIKTPCELSWVRINVLPLKSALELKVQRWTKVYTEFLLTQVKITLKNLTTFIKYVNNGIKVNPVDAKEDKNLLMAVMKVISDVKSVEPSADKIVKRLREMVVLLKKHQVTVEEDYLATIEKSWAEFIETTQKVFKIRADILPLQTQETVNIKKKLDEFSIKVKEFREEFLSKLPLVYEDSVSVDDMVKHYEKIEEYYSKTCEMEAKAKNYNELEVLFELEQSGYRQLRDCKVDLKSLKCLWDAISMVNYIYNDWKSKPWKQIKTDDLTNHNKNLTNILKNLPKEVKVFKGYQTINEKVKNMQTVLPLISSLHSEYMEKRHWIQLMSLTGKQIDVYAPTFCFDDILKLQLHKFEVQVNEIVDVAQKEAKIEKKLKNIESAWSKQLFEFEEVMETKIFKNVDLMMETLDAHTMDLMGMMSQGKYVEFFKVTVEEWRDKLRRVDTVVNLWLKVQKNWRRLVNIFLASDDIRSQLPEDTKRFEETDKDFREVMLDTFNEPLVVEACTNERKEILQAMLSNIEQCEKSLNEYLEGKKKAFPRFYFVSNQALLEILSNGNNPQKVTEYLGDMFDGMKALDFQVDKNTGQKLKSAVGMFSKDTEYVGFSSPFHCEGAVENWLGQLEFKMRATLAEILEIAKGTADNWDMEKPREEWLRDYCAQLSLVATQIIWTEEVNRAFEELEGGSEQAMKEYLKVIEGRIEALIKKVRGELTGEERTKIITIITIDVHSRDVVRKFVVYKLQDKEAFLWQSQLRFHWEKLKENSDMHQKQIFRFPWEKDREKQKCIIRIVDWARFYSYEYVGNCGRLVITPLTDRCYITLTQALNLYMGGAPAGPAGTGKTETTKDLGRAIGLAVMVFNCSDQMNYQTMAQIFMGLSQSGLWGCFDEFNRIAIEVLSVVSTQVKSVLDALKERKQRFLFMEEEINLVDTVGFFITMNPGYAGRTELPENLKALFRSCAMVVPDIVLICENMLMSEGFSTAQDLSKKFVTLYDLSKALLSKQIHYDWGLRAVKSVLRQAGKLKRRDPNLNEDRLLMRALRDFNLPKIITDDRSIFVRLIGDLFPGISIDSVTDEALKKLVKEATKTQGLIAEELFCMKAVQLSEILEVRHCCFVIGPPGCSKTAVWKVLGDSYKLRGEDWEYDTISPKAVTSNELFGYMTKTREWKDGVLSNIMRNQYKCWDKYKSDQKHKWLVLDGDIDPEWIESLNTVMDDNKLLTLVSNERIPLSAGMRLIFEVSNLRNATPATVSRGGVLYINESDVGWKPFMDSWMERSKEKKMQGDYINPNAKPPIDDIAKSVFYRCFQTYFEQNPEIHRLKHIAPVNDIMMIMTACCIIDSQLQEYQDAIKTLKEEDLKIVYEAMFLFACMWAVGGSVGGSDDDRDIKEFNTMWRAQAKIKFPEGGMCLDYFYDPGKMQWIPWATRIKPYQAVEEQMFSKIVVDTIHTTRLKYLLQQHVIMRKPILFIGSAGTGKTTVVRDYIAMTNKEQILNASISFNSFTNSLSVQRNIESRVEKKTGRIYGLPSNKLLLYFIDDLNMPYVDKYYTQTPIELIRQLIDYSSVFDREHLEEKKIIEDLLFLSCMNPKAGSFTVDLRLQRHFSVFTLATPTSDLLKMIYTSILGAHFSAFDNPIIKMNEKLVDATIILFNKIIKDTTFSPSARKFHYQFNLRETSKIVEGIMQSTPAQYKSQAPKMVKLWVHECKRVFEDRLIDPEDITKFRAYLKEVQTKNLGDEAGTEDPFAEPNIFTAFISMHHGNEKSYVPVADFPSLRKILDEKLNEYNETKPVMNLVLFDQAMEHVSRIARMLDQPGGHGLLVGVGGSGKQSLSKLASFILGYDIDTVVVSQNFSMNDLKGILQELFKKCTKTGPRVFMLTDSQIPDEAFLVYINDMLSSGFIPDLFPKEDLEAIVGNLRNEAKAAGYVDNADSLMQYFLDKLKRNLHVILCFSPVGDTLRVRARKFPGLINSTMIDWFHPWPKEALINVSSRFLDEIELPTEDMRKSIALEMAEVHASIDDANRRFLLQERRYNYTTPKSFLELIAFYKSLLGNKRSNIQKQIRRLENGLLTLKETQEKVLGLQENLKVVMVQVEERRQATDVLIAEVSRESAKAQEEQEKANAEEAKTTELSQAANKLKAECDVALQKALPALRAAEGAVNCLKKEHITEMKNLANPPDGVVLVAKVLMILRGEKVSASEQRDKTWKKGQQTMNNPMKFIEEIKAFPGENIDEGILTNVYAITKNPENQFSEEKMANKSYAASKLASWIVNICEYNRIYKEVKPLDDASKKSAETVQIKEKELEEVKRKVRLINEKVDGLRRKLAEAEADKAAVEAEAQRCQDKLTSAEKLVNGLADENKRWGENVKKLKENTQTVIGDALLAAAFVSYIAAFSARFRKDLWANKWLPDIKQKQIPMTEGIEPLKILTTDGEIAQWRNESLPADQMSLENASVITSCSRWPLLIDPQLQGSTWIRGHEGEDLVVFSLTQDRWMSKLVSAIQMGRTVMIENVPQEIDATLEPLLSRSWVKKGNAYFIDLGGDPIDYDLKFRLYLQTKLSNPHFRPELAAQCTIINFIVTEGGLEEQLLAMVVNVERPELEAEKSELVRKQNDFQVQLAKLEQNLLDSLSEANPATILENKQLIDNLDNTKKTSIDIAIQREKARVTEIEINKQREYYRKVAAEGAMLYFLLIALYVIDHMYQYSLESFTTFFFKAIERTEIRDETRVDHLRQNIRYTIYQWVSRGLFEKHKQIFLTQITFRLMQKKIIEIAYEPAQMQFLLNCAPKPGIENPLDWLPVQAWNCVQRLIELDEFKIFAQNMEKDAPLRFKDWYNELTPEEVKLPLDWKKLDQMFFQKLLVLRCLRPDRLTTALNMFIRQALPSGDQFVEMDQKLSFGDILLSAVDDSTPNTPIFFILSPGADPVKEVEKLGKRKGFEPNKNFWNIALGQGQDVIAMAKLELAHKEGHWVMLQNIHLMPKWLITLEKTLDAFALEGGGNNPAFRLFLSAEPSTGIPIGILDRSIKLTNEPPAGLKANMKKALTYFPRDEIEDKDPRLKSILFGLCFFHSTVLERRKFGPMGWNMFYPFNIGDLRDSYNVLNKYFEAQIGKIPWEDLTYIFGEIMYGGHIVDDWDRRLCKAYLDNLMKDALLDELELFPFVEGKSFSFKTPPPSTYEKYLEYIETTLTQETPIAYGLHPNAEIGFRTTQCINLFNTLLEVQPRDAGSSSDDSGGSQIKSKQEIAQELIKQVVEDINLRQFIFSLEDIKTRIEDKGPFQNVFLQECEYMNYLIIEIVRSLEELDQGFKGLLTISERMEQLMDAIALDRVPATWAKLAYASKRGLASWLSNLIKRIDQLNTWKDEPNSIPRVTMISRLFNPQSFLTAIKQTYSRKTQVELNKLMIATDVTKKSIEEIEGSAKEGGAYVFGFVLEGARWDLAGGNLEESKPKEMFSMMPVVNCKAAPLPVEGKEDPRFYQCPVYVTEDRGKTFVFTAQLKTKVNSRKWILAGVAIILDVESVAEEVKKAAPAK